MTTANKTTAWAFTTRIATLATNTTLATATRHDFAAITIDIPETTRTIRSVKLRVTARDAFTVATDFDGWRLGVKLGAVAFDDVDYASTAANTGDHETLIVERDVTAYFVTNFGFGASQTCQIGVAFATGAASNVNVITAELWVTYDYDTSAATQAKTVEIPIQGQHTTISTADVEIGTATGVSNAPVNQIPNLSTFCPEAGKTFKQIYLRVTANDGGAAATNFNLSIKLDAGAYDARATIEQTLITAVPYRDLVDLTVAPYSITTNAVHALVMKSSLAATFENVSAVLVATYTFTPSGTTREIHSVRVPLENERGALNVAHSATAGDDDRYSCLLDVQEPGAITILQSGVVVFDQMAGAPTMTTSLYNSGQGVRTYAKASLLRSGTHIYVRRTDHDSSTWALARGVNRLTIDARVTPLASCTELSGYAIVNYTSDIPASGIGTGNRSVAFALASHPTPATTATIIAAEERLVSFPASPWKISGGAWTEFGVRALLSIVTGAIQAERQPGEDSGNGWYAETFTAGNTGEIGRREFIRPITRWVRPSSFRSKGMDITATRRWRVASAASNITNVEWCGAVWLTVSDLTFTVAGVVTSGGSPVANGGPVKIYADDTVDAEYVTSTTTGGGTGAFTTQVLDNTRSYFTTYDVSGVRGWSGLATPGGSFNVAIGSAPTDVAITSTPTVSTIATTASFSFTASGPAEYSLDGSAYAPATSPIALSGLSVAVHTLIVRLIATPAVLETFVWTVASTSGPAPSPVPIPDSNFADLVAQMDRLAQNDLGALAIIYAPAVGSPVTVPGIFDANYVLSQGTGPAGVSVLGPAVFLRIEDLPTDPELDDPTITIAGLSYRVSERRPDDLGGIVLALRLVL
jgi:hypothetical protein